MSEGQRLVLEDIDCKPSDLPAFKRLDQSCLFNQRSARGIDQIGRRLHHCELGLPTIPRVFGLSTRWTVKKSPSRNSSAFDTSCAPEDSALSSLRFGLQAMTRIPKAFPIV